MNKAVLLLESDFSQINYMNSYNNTRNILTVIQNLFCTLRLALGVWFLCDFVINVIVRYTSRYDFFFNPQKASI